jgi:hypothetical protein
LTVAELIKELQKLPQEHPVYCTGGLKPFEISSVKPDRIEPDRGFQQVVYTELPPSPSGIDVVSLK